jgi:hypothetical protein
MDRKDQIKRARQAKEAQRNESQRAFDALLAEWQPQYDEALTTR